MRFSASAEFANESCFVNVIFVIVVTGVSTSCGMSIAWIQAIDRGRHAFQRIMS
jgi:hypothetical protein